MSKMMVVLAEPIATEIARIKALPNDQLLRELAEVLALNAAAFVRAATLIRECRDRGIDLTGIKLAMMPQILRIAYGQALPELFVRYFGRPALLRRFCILPIPDQQRLMSDEKLPVMIETEGKTDCILVHPMDMKPIDIQQVFSQDGIRNESQQISFLRTQKLRRPPKPPDNGVVVDRKRGCLFVNGHRLSINDLSRYLTELTS